MHVKKALTNINFYQKLGLIVGPVLFLIIWLFLDLVPGKPEVTRMLAIATLMSIWWITDAIPLFATSLLPLVLYPLMNVMTGKATAVTYINDVIFLFIGGFMIALAMERWNLHKRIALFIIRSVGGGPARIVLGFMVAGAFLSMWISNTATAIMMMPIGMAIIHQMESRFGKQESHKFSVGLMLGIGYSASIGGIATLVGTPPNLSFARIFQITFPNAPPITFGSWFMIGLPMAIIMLVIAWFIITKVFYKVPAEITADKAIIDNEYKALGAINYEEKIVLFIFLLTAVLWVFRADLNIGIATIPGWGKLLPFPKNIDDGTVSLFMALILLLIPSQSKKGESVLGAEVIKDLPWDIVLLFGGGFALAQGFQTTGLSAYIGNKFTALAGMHPVLMIIIVCFVLTFLTELTSNTAVTEMILPILASVAFAMKANPLLFMIPATISASFAFMMPVGTPPNAIVFGSGRVRISEMAKPGLVLNLVGIAVVTILFYSMGMVVFGIDPNVFPEWANQMVTKPVHK